MAQVKEVAKAHYDLQRYAEAYSIFLINSNTAKGFEGFDLCQDARVPTGGHGRGMNVPAIYGLVHLFLLTRT